MCENLIPCTYVLMTGILLNIYLQLLMIFNMLVLSNLFEKILFVISR